MVHDSRRAKVVVLASDGDDEHVIVKGPLRRDLAALSVEIRRNQHLTAIPIDSDHLPDPVAEAVPVGLRKIVDLVGGEIHAPGNSGASAPHSVRVRSISVCRALLAPYLSHARRKLHPPARPEITMRVFQLWLLDGLDHHSQIVNPLHAIGSIRTASAAATAALLTIRCRGRRVKMAGSRPAE